jgi:septal ring factor EnvC (AmiA/AmiB activator)
MKYIKLFEQFISEAETNEVAIEDPKITEQLGHFYELQNKIKEYEQEIENMKTEFKQFADELKPMMDGMKEVGDKLAKTEDFIVAISRFGGERKDASYKTAFENALSKVNASTKRVLEEALEASKKLTNVKHSFNIQKIEEANIFTKIAGMLKSAVSKFLGIFKKESKSIDDANKDLAKLAK